MAKSGPKTDHAVNMDAMKALVVMFGPSEASRQANVKVSTMLSWCRRYKWKKAVILKPVAGTLPPGTKDAGDMLRDSLEKFKVDSTMNLAQYTKNASQKAAKHKDPLEIARKVRDVAGVYSTLWPTEEQSELIEGGILIGREQVTDNLEEIKEAKATDVRQELPES